jgi:transposase
MERGERRLQRLRERRLKAVELFKQGERQATVAQILRASKQSVSEWWNAWQRGDTRAINGSTRAGRKPRLGKDDIKLIERELLRGAIAHGYATELWTLPRVAQLISKVTGVDFHPGHVWRILRKMGWSLQKPALQARERDDAKVQQWIKQDWEEVKKKRNDDDSG